MSRNAFNNVAHTSCALRAPHMHYSHFINNKSHKRPHITHRHCVMRCCVCCAVLPKHYMCVCVWNCRNDFCAVVRILLLLLLLLLLVALSGMAHGIWHGMAFGIHKFIRMFVGSVELFRELMLPFTSLLFVCFVDWLC